MDDKKLKAHISLLDDNDETVFQNVRDSLVKQGEEIINQLEEAWEFSNNELVQLRLENIINTIQNNVIIKEFTNWVSSGGHDIALGANIICKQKYFECDYSEINEVIDDLKSKVWLELHDNLTAFEKTKVINHVFFNEYKFRGDKAYYTNYKSYYINNVIARKKGSPIMLSIIYLAVAQKLDLPVFGVDLHNNFIIAYIDRLSVKLKLKEQAKLFFYINPFNKGSVFGKDEIDFYLKQQNVEKNEKFYQVVDNIVVIRRLILELMRLAKSKNEDSQLENLRTLYAITTKDFS
jgi:regulator of sirC expression with transglutaminase-like and TPR domain